MSIYIRCALVMVASLAVWLNSAASLHDKGVQTASRVTQSQPTRQMSLTLQPVAWTCTSQCGTSAQLRDN